MTDQPNSSELITQQPSALVSQQPNIVQLQNFEIALLGFLAQQGLPTQSVFVAMETFIHFFQCFLGIKSPLAGETN